MRKFEHPAGVVQAGETLENVVSGERLTFLATSRETGGAYTRVHFTLPPRGRGTRAHLHTTLSESFEVISGRLNVSLEGTEPPLVLWPGQSASVPPYTVHRFWNATDEETVFQAIVRPSGGFEAFMRTSFDLAREGRTTGGGVPRNPLDLGLLMEPADVYLPGLPVPAQKVVFGALASAARRLGYGPSFALCADPSTGEGGSVGATGTKAYGTVLRKIDERAQTLAAGVGWVSLGMGLALTLAPRGSAAQLGWGNRAALARVIGAADLIVGPALLLGRNRERWMTARALLSAVITVAYARALASGTTPRKGRAVGGVVGMSVLTLMDHFLARQLRKTGGTPDDIGG